MYNYKATTSEKLENTKSDKEFKKNSYEEIRKLVEDNEGNNIVKEIKNEKRKIKKILKIFG